MDNFVNVESEYYDFYRFSRLVHDVLMQPNGIQIPYDIEMSIIYSAYTGFTFVDNGFNSPYDAQLEYIQNKPELLKTLLCHNVA